MSQRDELIDVGTSTSAASTKCWILKASIDGAVGGVPLGCLDCNNSHVVSVLGAIPVEVRAWQAMPHNPSLARDMAIMILWLVLHCLKWRSLDMAWWVACTQRLSHRPWNHKLQRWPIGIGLWWHPLHLDETRTHLGSRKSFNYDTSSFINNTDLKVGR